MPQEPWWGSSRERGRKETRRGSNQPAYGPSDPGHWTSSVSSPKVAKLFSANEAWAFGLILA